MRPLLFLFFIASGTAWAQTDDGPRQWVETNLTPGIGKVPLRIAAQVEPKPKEFQDPRDKLTYSWFAYAFAKLPRKDANQYDTRFAVFAQSERELQRVRQVTRLLLRLWELTYAKLQIDHPAETPFIEVFLSWGGTKTGGEQLLFKNPGGPRHNLIYIYQTSTISSPVEWVREVAHEYGHAVLPGITGYSAPEPWANGMLGERLYMRWLIQEMEAGRISSDDVMGASAEQLKAWEAKYITPMERGIWEHGLDFKKYIEQDKASMMEYVSLALYMESAYGTPILARAMRAAGGNRPVDFLNGCSFALSEKPEVAVQIPKLARAYLFLPGSLWKCAPARKLIAKGAGWHIVENAGGLKLKLTHRMAE